MSKNALIVDNNYFFVEFLGELLAKRGYRVAKAYDGKDGISKLQSASTDIIFLDLIMSKVDVRQFIEFVRIKFPQNHVPIVALSGTVIEQMSEVDEIGADYYIPKGPTDKLTVLLNKFMTAIETGAFLSGPQKKIINSENIFPRREAMELLNELQFQRAIVANIGVGVVVVDKDTRVLNANAMALGIIQKSAVDVLACRVVDVFPSELSAEVKEAFKRVVYDPHTAHVSFCARIHHHHVQTIVSAIGGERNNLGWVIALNVIEHDSA